MVEAFKKIPYAAPGHASASLALMRSIHALSCFCFFFFFNGLHFGLDGHGNFVSCACSIVTNL
jgi:hypothetical protein